MLARYLLHIVSLNSLDNSVQSSLIFWQISCCFHHFFSDPVHLRAVQVTVFFISKLFVTNMARSRLLLDMLVFKMPLGVVLVVELGPTLHANKLASTIVYYPLSHQGLKVCRKKKKQRVAESHLGLIFVFLDRWLTFL